MRAIKITQYGSPDVLHLVTEPDPAPAQGEVLIRVKASGINRPDVLQRKGHYPVPPGASELPGLEVAGEIVSGDRQAMQAAGFSVGDKVCALVAGGGYAELCVAPVLQCLPMPANLTWVQAAALPETFFTVWSNVFQRGRLQSGEVLLVQGGTSGIGVTSIMLAKQFGAYVIVTAGSDEKCDACLKLGADTAINYKTQDFEKVVMQVTNGKGADVILDMVAGGYVAREVNCLAEDGRLVIIAVQGGIASEFDAGKVLRRRLVITGSTLRPRPIAFKGQIAAELKANVWPMIERGDIQPVVDQVFAPQDVVQAHTRMESRAHVGKLVLDWQLLAD